LRGWPLVGGVRVRIGVEGVGLTVGAGLVFLGHDGVGGVVGSLRTGRDDG
jgi:hypothetical protein